MIRGWRAVSVVLLASYKEAWTRFDRTPARGYLSLLSDKADKSTTSLGAFKKQNQKKTSRWPDRA